MGLAVETGRASAQPVARLGSGGRTLRHRPSCKVGEDEKNQQSGEASGLAKPPLVALQAVEPVGRLSAWLRGGLREFCARQQLRRLEGAPTWCLRGSSRGAPAWPDTIVLFCVSGHG